MVTGVTRSGLLLATLVALFAGPSIAGADPAAWLVHASADVQVVRGGSPVPTRFGMELEAGDHLVPASAAAVELTLVVADRVVQARTSAERAYEVAAGETAPASGGVWDQLQVALGSLAEPASPETEIGAVAHDQILVRPDLLDRGSTMKERLDPPGGAREDVSPEDSGPAGAEDATGSSLASGLGASAGGALSRRSVPRAAEPAPPTPTLLFARWIDPRPVTEITAVAGAGPFERRLAAGCRWEEGAPVASLDEADTIALDSGSEPCFMVSSGSALWTLSLGNAPGGATRSLTALWEDRASLGLDAALAAGLAAERLGLVFLARAFYQTALDASRSRGDTLPPSLRASLEARLTDLHLLVGDPISR